MRSLLCLLLLAFSFPPTAWARRSVTLSPSLTLWELSFKEPYHQTILTFPAQNGVGCVLRLTFSAGTAWTFDLEAGNPNRFRPKKPLALELTGEERTDENLRILLQSASRDVWGTLTCVAATKPASLITAGDTILASESPDFRYSAALKKGEVKCTEWRGLLRGRVKSWQKDEGPEGLFSCSYQLEPELLEGRGECDIDADELKAAPPVLSDADCSLSDGQILTGELIERGLSHYWAKKPLVGPFNK